MRKAIVFIHGVNPHLPRARQEEAWRKAVERGEISLVGVPSKFCFYADWFFPESVTPSLSEVLVAAAVDAVSELTDDQDELLDRLTKRVLKSEAAAALAMKPGLERSMSRGHGTPDPSKEGLSNLDITTLLPPAMVKAALGSLAHQLYAYFENRSITAPGGTDSAKSRDLIRKLFRNAVRDARTRVGESGKVIVLAHSMGSVVAWDCLNHDARCGSVDGLVTFGSPLGLDFVQRGLADANGSKYDRTFPDRLRGKWVNLVANFDVAAVLDTDFDDIFPGGGGNEPRTVRMSNPDFRAFGPLGTRISSAHSGSGYLRSKPMADALEAFGMTRRRSAFESVSSHPSARVEALAVQRYNSHRAARERKRARLEAQSSVLGVEVDERIVNKLTLRGLDHITAAHMVADAHENAAGRVVLERVLGAPDFLQRSYALKMAVLTGAVGQIVIGGQPPPHPAGSARAF